MSRTPPLDRRLHRRLPVAFGCLVVVAAGCSSGRYDADYAKAVSEHRTRAEFSRLQETAVDLADGRVRVHPPKSLPDLLKENGADPRFPAGEDGQSKPIAPKRLRPPFLESPPPLLSIAAEGLFGQANGKLPATLSLAAVPVTEMSEADLGKNILARLRKEEAFDTAKPEWQSLEVIDRTGATRNWRVLEVHGSQRIDRFVGAKEPNEDPIDTTIAIWLSADRDQEFCTVLVWRVPDEIKGSVGLEEIAPLVARSVSIAPPPDRKPEGDRKPPTDLRKNQTDSRKK